MFANREIEEEINEEQKLRYENQLRQQQKREQQEQCRVLNDILGETQWKAMLNRIMSDMEALALQMDRNPMQVDKQRGIQNSSRYGGIRTSGDDAGEDNCLASPIRKPSHLRAALRSSLFSAVSADPSSSTTIALLPQRRMSSLGAIQLEERMTYDDTPDSEDGDDEGDDGESEETGYDRKRTAESIAMAEIRKLQKRHQRKLQSQSEHANGGARSNLDPQIYWEKSSRVKVAQDIPASLQIPLQLTLASAPDSHQPTMRVSSTVNTVSAASPQDVGLTSQASSFGDEQQSFDNLITRRRRPFLTRTDSTQSIAVAADSKSSQPSKTSHSPPLSPIVSPWEARKLQAPYGAWYLPRQEWWTLHQSEQQALAERFPLEARALAQLQQDDHHCHHAPQDRNHKPALIGQETASASALLCGRVVARSPAAAHSHRRKMEIRAPLPLHCTNTADDHHSAVGLQLAASTAEKEDGARIGRIPVRNHEVGEEQRGKVQPELMSFNVEEEDRTHSVLQLPPSQQQIRCNALARVRSLRTLVSCWCAYECRWVQALHSPCHSILEQQQPQYTEETNQNIEAYFVDEEFELELENFHALVVHNVTSESTLEYPRKKIERYVTDWAGMDKRIRKWWEPRKDLALACAADLQLVVPDVWIGSALTWEQPDAIATKKITHIVHCCTSVVRQFGAVDAIPVVQSAVSPLPSTLAYTITLSELPRLDFLQQQRDVSRKGNAAQTATWEELDTASKFIFDTMWARATGDKDTEHGHDARETASKRRLLLYCESGVSTSITVCAALLMYRFCLPLDCAMLLLSTARRFTAPSKYLMSQLERFDLELQRRRIGTRLPLHKAPG
ncbi:hypothetical protein FI667_g11154, partial [Globisporangium splendens]